MNTHMNVTILLDEKAWLSHTEAWNCIAALQVTHETAEISSLMTSEQAKFSIIPLGMNVKESTCQKNPQQPPTNQPKKTKNALAIHISEIPLFRG